MAVIRVYIVRHGETGENRLGIMQGQLDTKLNAAGIEQAQLAADVLEVVPFRKAFSSDLQRAAKTAEIILEKHPGVPLEKHAELRERHLGDWQGQKLDGRGSTAPANSEPLTDFNLRAARWWTRTIVPYAESLHAIQAKENGSTEQTQEKDDGDSQPACVLVVSHGGYISRLIANLVQSGQVKCAEGVLVSGKCWNASISVVDVRADGTGVLVSYSDTTHLRTDFVRTNADVINQ